MKNSITHVIFDLGGVLIKLSPPETFLSYLKENGISQEQMALFMPDMDRLGKGEVSLVDIHRKLVQAGFSAGFEPFKTAFINYMLGDEVDGMIPFLEQLKEDFNISILSNTNAWHVDYIRNQYGLFSLMDNLFFSNEIGLLKPDKAIFQHVLTALSVEPRSVLFLDDIAENIESAKSLGINTIHVKHNHYSGDEIKAFLESKKKAGLS